MASMNQPAAGIMGKVKQYINKTSVIISSALMAGFISLIIVNAVLGGTITEKKARIEAVNADIAFTSEEHNGLRLQIDKLSASIQTQTDLNTTAAQKSIEIARLKSEADVLDTEKETSDRRLVELQPTADMIAGLSGRTVDLSEFDFLNNSPIPYSPANGDLQKGLAEQLESISNWQNLILGRFDFLTSYVLGRGSSEAKRNAIEFLVQVNEDVEKYVRDDTITFNEQLWKIMAYRDAVETIYSWRESDTDLALFMHLSDAFERNSMDFNRKIARDTMVQQEVASTLFLSTFRTAAEVNKLISPDNMDWEMDTIGGKLYEFSQPRFPSYDGDMYWDIHVKVMDDYWVKNIQNGQKLYKDTVDKFFSMWATFPHISSSSQVKNVTWNTGYWLTTYMKGDYPIAFMRSSMTDRYDIVARAYYNMNGNVMSLEDLKKSITVTSDARGNWQFVNGISWTDWSSRNKADYDVIWSYYTSFNNLYTEFSRVPSPW